MLQSEFEERTGIESIKEYAIANFLYMLLEYDKDSFCAYWTDLRDEPMFTDVVEILFKLSDHITSACNVLKMK